MSQHPSLRVDNVGTRHRNVLKRAERIKKMMDENRWAEEKSVFGLPKIKSLKVKVKKVKAAKEGEEKPGTAPAAPEAAKKSDAAKKSEAPKKSETAKKA